eukprot:6013652-Amphidinium_carterae.1
MAGAGPQPPQSGGASKYKQCRQDTNASKCTLARAVSAAGGKQDKPNECRGASVTASPTRVARKTNGMQASQANRQAHVPWEPTSRHTARQLMVVLANVV